jgi:hypothetical protein
MEKLKQQIAAAFAQVEYPGDDNLRNSDEGEEPYLLEAEFKGQDDWTRLSPEFIDGAPDGYASALSFFSPAALRFYLPAYLIADLNGALEQADPIFYLTHGLTQGTKDAFINPQRYGEYTWFEYVEERFAGFSQEEAKAIHAYLTHQMKLAVTDYDRLLIAEALENYWTHRARPQNT